MKKLLSFMMVLAMMVSILMLPLQAATPRSNYTVDANAEFQIKSDGRAEIFVFYEANDAMTSAQINITLKKRVFLLFWEDVTTFTFNRTEKSFSNTYIYYLQEEGTYKCEVEYIISGTAGANDVSNFEHTATY